MRSTTCHLAVWLLARAAMGGVWGGLVSFFLARLFGGWFTSWPQPSPYWPVILGGMGYGFAGGIVISAFDCAISQALTGLRTFVRAVVLVSGGAAISGLAVSAWQVYKLGVLVGQPPNSVADQVWWIVTYTLVPNLYSGAILGALVHLTFTARARKREIPNGTPAP